MNKRFSHIKRRITDIIKSYQKPKKPLTLDDEILSYFEQGFNDPYELAEAMGMNVVDLYFAATNIRARANIRVRLNQDDDTRIKQRHYENIYGKR